MIKASSFLSPTEAELPYPQIQQSEAIARYNAGMANADELFDPYFIDEPPAERQFNNAKTEWDEEFEDRLKAIHPKEKFLTRDEENALSLKVQAGIEAANDPAIWSKENKPSDRRALRRTARAGEQAQVELFNDNVRFVAWFARESLGMHKQNDARNGRPSKKSHYVRDGFIHDYASAPLEYADRFQIMSVGFWKAIEKHDPAKGSLRSMATWYMESALRREIENSSYGYISRIPAHAHAAYGKILNGAVQAESTGAEGPNLEELSYETGLPTGKVVELAGVVGAMARHTSIEDINERLAAEDEQAYHEPEEVLSLADRVRAEQDIDSFDVAEIDLMLGAIYGALDKLSEKRLTYALELRFGLVDGMPKTLDEVGEYFNLTRERIRQLEAKALTELRGMDSLRSIMASADDSSAASYNGLRPGALALTSEEVVRLALPGHIRFDTSPSDKYKVKPAKKQRFVYKDDWLDGKSTK